MLRRIQAFVKQNCAALLSIWDEAALYKTWSLLPSAYAQPHSPPFPSCDDVFPLGHPNFRVVEADLQKSRRISLLCLCSLITGTICTMTACIIDNQYHSSRGFVTTNPTPHAIPALRFVEVFLLAHVLKARRGWASGMGDPPGQNTNESSERLGVEGCGEKEGAAGKE